MAKVILEKIYKSFPNRDEKEKDSQVSVLRDINLTVEDGEFMVLVGPSGCGKSTLLRLIAGLEKMTGGKIFVGDKEVNELPPKARDIAMVFQNYALYPHLSVRDNIAFGLRRMEQNIDFSSDSSLTIKGKQKQALPSWLENSLVGMTRKLPKRWRYLSEKEKQINEIVTKVAEDLQIEYLLKRLPKELSGGQKQRVALGRAIARNPQVFLMDEPLSNLDAKLRAETRNLIVTKQRELGITTIYVTHDQTEAMTMGHRIAVMNEGKTQQIDNPLALYNFPKNRFVAEFIGSPPMNFLSVKVTALLLLTQAQFRLTLPEKWEYYLTPYNGQQLVLGIRPEHLNVSPPAPKNLHVQVDLVEALGHETYLAVHLVENPNSKLQVRISPDQMVKIGDYLWLSIALDKIHLFDSKSGNNIVLT